MPKSEGVLPTLLPDNGNRSCPPDVVLLILRQGQWGKSRQHMIPYVTYRGQSPAELYENNCTDAGIPK